ncbi:manganese efflux pump [bacterium]|nr:manganese efflux pump [bacterium]
MSIVDILILAIALSIDASVVSFTNGLVFKEKRLIKSLILAFSVGFFQFFMPLVGYVFAQFVTDFVKPYSHWLIFSIFFILGVKFIKDAFNEQKQQESMCNAHYILAVSIATSIDALFAGVSISFSGLSVWLPSIIIGIVTFINSMLGFWSAKLIKNVSTKFLEITGGVILILLAFKVLFNALL